jgi:hypothetical protein
MHDRPNANVLDFRMGTSSITINTPLHMYDYINKKDLVTTTASDGFRVTAYIVKDASGNVIEKLKSKKIKKSGNEKKKNKTKSKDELL